MNKFKLSFSGKNFLLFLGVQLIIIIGGILYLSALTENVGFASVALVFSVVVALIITLIGLTLTKIVKIKYIYFVIPILMAYPVISAWITMLHEEDLLQVIVDFFFLAPLLGGLVMSLPGYLLLTRKTANDDTINTED